MHGKRAMTRRRGSVYRRAPALVAALFFAATGVMTASTLRVGWNDLLQTPLAAGRDTGGAPLQGRMVELTGYLLPADQEGDLVYSFLLLPEYGGCIHTPAPPPDQIVRVTPAKPFAAKSIYQVVQVSGVLRADRERTQLFVLDGVKVVESGYAISKAVVRETNEPVEAPRAAARNPWRRFGQPKG